MKMHVPILVAALALASCNQAPAETQVQVEDAVVTVPAVPGGAGAAYFTLSTNNDPTRLMAIASPQVERVEFHETLEENGVTRMLPLQPGKATFDPSRPLRFAPGGKHAMLFGLDPSLRPGDKVELVFHIEPGQEVAAQAEVRGPGQAHDMH